MSDIAASLLHNSDHDKESNFLNPSLITVSDKTDFLKFYYF